MVYNTQAGKDKEAFKEIPQRAAEGREAFGTQVKISGTGYDPRTIEGKASLKRLKLYKTSEDGIHCEIDLGRIREIIAAYVDPARRRETRARKNGTDEEVFYAPINRPGLRLKLGIGRGTYNMWLLGFADGQEGEGYIANEELADAMREGDDSIAKYLIENNDSGSSAKSIKLLEAMGEFEPASAGSENSGAAEGRSSPFMAAGEWAKRAE